VVEYRTNRRTRGSFIVGDAALRDTLKTLQYPGIERQVRATGLPDRIFADGTEQAIEILRSIVPNAHSSSYAPGRYFEITLEGLYGPVHYSETILPDGKSLWTRRVEK